MWEEITSCREIPESGEMHEWEEITEPAKVQEWERFPSAGKLQKCGEITFVRVFLRLNMGVAYFPSFCMSPEGNYTWI